MTAIICCGIYMQMVLREQKNETQPHVNLCSCSYSILVATNSCLSYRPHLIRIRKCFMIPTELANIYR